MNKIIRTLLLMALMLPWVATAQNTLTVAEGTATNSNVPVYGLWADAYLRCQTIYPASEIATATTTVGMAGGSITGLTYYLTTPAAAAWTGTFEVKMMETSSTTLSAFADMTDATTVYTGGLDGTGSTLAITFATPYTYNGGNLLIEVNQTTPGVWKSATFGGVSASGASWQGYSSSSWSGITGSAQNFIPKTTFTFTGGQAVTCPPIQGIALGDIDSNSAVISWVDTMNIGANYTVTYWPQNATANDTMTATAQTTTTTLTGLNANTQYHYTIQVNCSSSDNSIALGGSFRTACGTISLPYFVDFEDAAYNGAWYPCWDSTIHAGTDPSVNDQNSPANHTTGGTYAMYLQSNSSENYNLVVSPAVPLQGDQIFVSFWARCNSSAWMKAGVITNPHDTSTFIPLVTVSGNSWNEYTFTTANLDPTATYYVAWLGYRNNGFIGKFDDVLIREDLGCNKPSLAVLDSVGPYSADLRWTNGGGAATAYDLFYNTTNDIATATVEAGLTDTVFTLTNLLPQTTYYAWVRTACGSDSADVKAFPSFTTQMTCAPVTGAAIGNISYTSAQINWSYNTTEGFPTEGVHIVLTDNTDTTATPEEIDVIGNSYTFSNLQAGHGYTATLRNMCTAPGQTDTATGVNVSFMTSSCSEIASDGSTTNYIPTYTYYNYSYAQAIYTRFQMPNIDSIHGVAFNVTSVGSSSNVRNIDVYMGLTSATGFASGTSWVPVSGMTLVASNVSLDASTTGWKVISFDTTFYYDGTSNLVIAIDDNSGTWVSSPSWAALSTNGQGLYKYNDPTNYDPTDPPSGTVINNIPAVRFVADCEVPQCFAPMLTLDSVDANNITVSWVSVGTESSWAVGIKAYGDSVYTYEANPVTDTFYTFSNLSGSTLYEVVVGSLCDGDTLFAVIEATTPCASGTCDVTVDMTDGYGDGWNGNSVQAYQNGALAGSATIASGSTGTGTISVCSGLPVEFRLHVGSYPDEISFTIYDGGGTTLYTAAEGTFDYNTAEDTLLASTPDACPSCMRPTGLMATVIDSMELGFSWDYSDTVSGYVISFNGGPWTSYSGTLPYMENNLTPNTAYTFSVMSVCSAADTSVATTITVKTACGGMVLPYAEDFEAEANDAVPSCWTVVRPGYDGYPGVSGSSVYAHSGSKYLTLAADYNDSTTIATNLVPLNGDQIQVSFWASVNQGNTIKAGVMTSLAYDSTFIPLLTIPSNNGTYTRYEFNTSTLSPYDQFYVAFRLVTGGSNHYADIDDINIFQNQGCAYPANITANPGAHNIALVWSCSANTPNFVIEYHDNASTAWTTAGSTTDTSYDITGLNAATMYQMRIGLICNNDTLWSTVSAQTTCDLLALPYFENFDSYAEHVLPPCWSIAIPGTSLSTNSGVTHYDGGIFFRSNNGGAANYAVVPQLDGNITKFQIEFDCKVGSPTEQDGILFGVADAAGVLIAWLDTIQDPNHSRNAHVHHIINMLNYTVPSGAERIAFAQYRNWYEWALIDNINIVSLPECYPVDSLQAHNLIDPDHTSFTWASLGTESAWQVYVDTVTVDIDNIPDSLLVDVYTRSYEIPMGTIQGGGIYTFYVRANCGTDQSNWNSYTFGAGSFVMNNSSVADTIVACGLVVYDNGGSIAGYVGNSNSSLVIRAENAGSELQIFGGKFGFGASPATLTVYDGEGTTGTVLYTYNQMNTNNDIYDTILATTTTGAMTITFTVSGEMCHTGYELYIHCVGSALCERPTQLQATMTGAGQADVSWSGSSASYELYYKPTGATAWTVQGGITGTTTTVTGLIADTTYDMQVVGICGTDTSTPSFPIVLNTEYTVVITPCDPVTDVAVSDVTATTATVSWTSTGDTWVISYKHLTVTDTITVTTNPYTLTGLLPNMDYTVKVRNVCSGVNQDPLSDWSETVNFHTPNATPTSFTITVASNNDDWGTVDGGGTYAAGSTATLTANPKNGFEFVRWNDNNTDNPRNVVVNADATYTAYFEAITGIADVDGGTLTLSPNPASTSVTLGIEGFSGVVNVEIVDMNGKVCGKWTVTSGQLTVDLNGYAQGAYFVRVTGEQQTAVRKLIVR